MNVSQTSLRVFVLACIISALYGGFVILSRTGAIAFLEDGPSLIRWIEHLGMLGPLAVIGLMTAAIVVSPVPSAPIALAAGAMYGHFAGTLYVALGSELGAIIAFSIARLAGPLTAFRLSKSRKVLLGTQNALMGIVFVSRLLPFISFDMVSYAAGVSPLRFWRFAIATLAGILPASFLLAHFGSEMASGENQRIGLTVFLLGGVSLAVLLYRWYTGRRMDDSKNQMND